MKRHVLALLGIVSVCVAVGADAAESRASEPAVIVKVAPDVRVEGDMLRLRLPKTASASQPPYKGLPSSSREWLEQMLDSSRHGVAFKDPQAFIEWLDAITEPQFMTALATASIDPNVYSHVLSAMIRPETARNWAEFTNPLLYLRWMVTGANPDFYNAIIERFSDPGKLSRWARYGGPSISAPPTLNVAADSATGSANPALDKSIAMFANPRSYLDWAGGFAEAAAHPKTDLPAWKRLPMAARANPIYRY
jgi:hypothetical protein